MDLPDKRNEEVDALERISQVRVFVLVEPKANNLHNRVQNEDKDEEQVPLPKKLTFRFVIL